MITRWEVACVLLVAAGIAVGWLLGHWRAYAECCDCCTCQTCTDQEPIEGIVLPSGPRPVDMSSFWDDTVSNLELHAIAEPVAYELESHAEPTTSTWLMEQRIWMEAKHPIPVGAP